MKVYVYARKFAKALYRVETNKEQLALELRTLAPYWSQLNMYIPMYMSDSDKQARLDALGVMPTMNRLLMELSRIGMMRLFPKVSEQYVQFMNEENQTLVARVTAKRALSQSEQDMLCDTLRAKHHKAITLEQQIDENVIDGLKVEVDYYVFDDTVATKLELIIQKLSYEMEAV